MIGTTQGIVDNIDPIMRKIGRPTVIPSAAADFGGFIGATPKYDVGFIGSFMPGKGLEFVEKLAIAAPQFSFVLYGDASKDLALSERLRRLGNVSLAGYVSPSKIGTALASFRVGLAPYDRAGFGEQGSAFIRADALSSLKILEYMSAGRVILASRIPAVEAMLTDGETAMLCDPDNPDSWTAGLDALIKNSEASDVLAAAARRRYQEHFSFESRAERFNTVIHGLMGIHPPKAAAEL
ncbi:glycosyltransferase family 4 protein [Sphingomonas sp. BIUV-7]|uniref:Glycosyltransferase family 4 protein n=1 Tax=Sphingomonas natans TaxID=3063330 RepID=A0ABT8YCJ3_9SPHN|nr:glycosyltransferase family 4 protein [Sphingomonas sp. BIUV-7]MDO6416075.1 glycosyltransferase family 4 protein [Sphingomonas sp. BIUV-7]